MYVIDNIERTKNAADCSNNNSRIKIESKSIIFTINCSKSCSVSTSLVVKVVTNFIL